MDSFVKQQPIESLIPVFVIFEPNYDICTDDYAAQMGYFIWTMKYSEIA